MATDTSPNVLTLGIKLWCDPDSHNYVKFDDHRVVCSKCGDTRWIVQPTYPQTYPWVWPYRGTPVNPHTTMITWTSDQTTRNTHIVAIY